VSLVFVVVGDWWLLML